LPEPSGVASASERLMPAALLLSAAPLTLSTALLPDCAAPSFLDASAASSPSPRFHVSSAQNKCFSRVFTCQSQSSTKSRQLQQPPLLTPFNPVFPQPRTNVSAQWLLTLQASSRGVRLRVCAHLICLIDHFNSIPLITPFQNLLALEHVGQLFCGAFKLRLIHGEDIGL
jgi:hypothetical protein